MSRPATTGSVNPQGKCGQLTNDGFPVKLHVQHYAGESGKFTLAR